MSRSRKKSKKTPKKTGRPRSSENTREKAPGAPSARKRKRSGLLVGLAGVVVVAAVVALVLRPEGSGEKVGGTGARPAAEAASDLDLRNETFDVARLLVSDFPRSADPLGLMGTVQNQFGNSAEAEVWWWKCLELDPKRVDIYEVLAVAYLRKGEYERVAELLDRAQSVDVDLPGVHLRYAEALLELGRLDEALAMIQEEMKLSTEVTENYMVMGRIRMQRREYALAVEAYAEAARRRPSASKPYYGLATASARLGRGEESREYMATFQRLRAVEDDASTSRRRTTDKMRPVAQILVEVLVDAGRVYEAHGRHDRAEVSWRRAAELDPANTASRIQLVNRYRSTERRWEAVEVCAELRKIDPGNARYHYVAGLTLAELGQFDAAREALRQAAELSPGDEKMQNAYQRLLERQ